MGPAKNCVGKITKIQLIAFPKSPTFSFASLIFESMQQPRPLKKGDSITLLSTARKISPPELQAFVDCAEGWGLKVNFADNLFGEYHQFAGSIDQRVADLQNALDDENCKAIFCARGGYGTVQLIDKIDFAKFQQQPKWIVGYSDVTVLHNHINQNFGIESLHAIMPFEFKETANKEAIHSLQKALFSEEYSIDFIPEEHSILPKSEISAPIVGGNLSILYSLSGSKSQINTAGKWLFIEDLDEYLYHIDRMMMNLKRSGLFQGCIGILVGGMSDMNDNTIPYGQTAKEIILENTKALNIPVIFGFPAGHIHRNLAITFNRKTSLLISDSKAKLSFHGRTQ